MHRHKGGLHLGQEAGWQEAVVIAAGLRNLAQVVSRPDKLVPLSDDDPGTLLVETEVALDGRRYFNGGRGDNGRAMGDRQHGHNGRSIGLPLNRQHDHAGPVLPTLLAASLMFVVPKVRIRDDQADFGIRERHESPRLGIEQGVEMGMVRVHAGRRDGLHLLGGQVGRGEAATLHADF